jgi:5-methylcytosine-specific restriction endonuclease McrA|tara:strand:+ start:1384 stop:1842 length:459 start_codon:yes stop_codon:yes gene_type:complete
MLSDKLIIAAGVASAVVTVASIVGDLIETIDNSQQNLPNRQSKTIEARAFNPGYNSFISPKRPSRVRANNSQYPSKLKVCRICNNKGYTEWHHIISRGYAKRNDETELIENPGNIVELCKKCHNKTTASMNHRFLSNRDKKSNNKLWKSFRK